MARKKWIFKKIDKDLAKELAEECDVDPMVALLLSARGYTDPVDIESFVGNDQQMADPFELPDMQPAVWRIQRAMENGEKIAVCGDYDADGVTASALLYTYLTEKGCDVICDIPERLEEGYGLHISTIDRLHKQEVNLIVTVDNGIGAVNEVEYAANLGMDVVVTDHHRPGKEIPKAVAVVDPYVGMPEDCFADYAGVGVAFKLICAIEGCSCEEMMEKYGDLVAIGTVADVVPLVEENRLLVQQGVAVLNRLERVGLRELIFAADISAEEITADKISFAIAPRINAAGRMGRSYRAFELLTTDDENEAKQLAGEVCFENMRRQDVEAVVTDACRIEYMQSGMQIYDRVIVIAGYNWHHGVLGIVAARICAQFGKPTIILTIDGDTAKGSARSIEGFDLFAALSACSDCLLQYGGHTLAAGVSIETDRICEFREKINQYARSLGKRPVPQLSIDCKLSPLGAGERTATAIQCLTPHGCQNPAPIFALMNMEIDAIQPVGGGKSLRLTMSKDGVTVVCMKFSTSAQDFPFYVGDFVDVAVAFRYGTFRNRPAFSMAVQDIRPAGFNDQDMFCEMNLFEDFMAGVDISKESRLQLLPSREELGIVFRFLRKSQHLKIQPDVLMAKMDYVISMGKILVALKVFEEFDFIRYEFDGDFLHVEYLSPTEKHDLSNSQILLKLQM